MPRKGQSVTILLREELKKSQKAIENELRNNINYFCELEYADESSDLKAVFSAVKSKLMRPELYRMWLKGLAKVKLIELTETTETFEWKFPVKVQDIQTSKIGKETIVNAVIEQQEELESFL
ncbi:MAG: hypothetical protein ACFFD4_09070 [Candidatus Odinarchaeota archaeon]